MKKVLLASSALALAGAFASPAASADREIRVGGYMEQYLAFASSDLDGVPETAFIPFSASAGGVNVGDDVFRRMLGTTYLENSGNNDAQRFTYFTPRFAGFELDVSYAREARQDDNEQVNCDSRECDFFDVGANYVNSFGDFNVALSGRWGIASAAAAPNPEVWSAGFNLGYRGFTIGGSFAEQNNAGLVNGEAYDAGISYETGPWGFSFTYFRSENADNEFPAASGNGETQEAFLLGASYMLATGVALNAFGAYIDFDQDISDGGGGSGDDIDGFIIGTGVKINF